MNSSEQIDFEQQEAPSYSRAARHRSQAAETEKMRLQGRRETPKSTKVPSGHKFLILVLSLIVSCLSVAIPFLTDFANGIQSQNLYTGLMFSQGSLPYTNMYATGGFLYYVLIALAYYLGSTLWLIPVQAGAFYLSGIYLYKLVNYFTDSQKVAQTFCLIFYLLNAGLGFGGLYPVQFAMPFVLVSLWFLTKYFAGIINDEAFILYGFAGAAAMLLEPRTLIFWGISFVMILVFNIGQKHVARGIYQLLCIVFGTILIIYTAAYFILNLEILSPYISQAIIYQFTYFAVSSNNLWTTLSYQLLVALASGLLFGVFTFFNSLKTKQDRFVKWLIFFVLLVNLLIACLSQDYHLYHLLPAVPYGLILTALPIGQRYQAQMTKTSHRRKVGGNNKKSALKIFMGRNFYLPYLVVILGIAVPIATAVWASGTNEQRSALAAYLKGTVSSDQSVYVWDTTAKVYIDSGISSSSQFAVPSINTVKTSNEQLLEDELLQKKASYIVVNSSESLPDDVAAMISTYYTQVSVDGVTAFTVYQKN